jgi:glutaredoxin 3
MAKRLLDSKGLAYEYRAIMGIDSKKEFFEATNGAKSIPQILINGKLIGGYEQLRALINDQIN